MNIKKFFILLLILLIGTAAWLYFNKEGVEFLSENGTQDTVDKISHQEKIEDDETWLTYSSDIFRLQFDYPDHLQVEETVTGSNMIEAAEMNQEAVLVIKSDPKDDQRIFVVTVIEPDMLEHVKLYSKDEQPVQVGKREALQMKKENMNDEASFDFFTQTLVEFPNFYYLFLSDGENRLYDDILETVRFIE